MRIWSQQFVARYAYKLSVQIEPFKIEQMIFGSSPDCFMVKT